MLNKLIAVKVLAALTVAGLGTGAAAGELPDPLQDLASEAAEIVDVEIPDPDREADEAEKAAEKAAKDAEKVAEQATKDAEKADAADDEADESGDAGKKAKRDNHGAVVSECARTTKLQGRAKGQAISALARGDVDQCDLGEGSGDRTSKEESRQADKEAKMAAKEQRKASKGTGETDPAE